MYFTHDIPVISPMLLGEITSMLAGQPGSAQDPLGCASGKTVPSCVHQVSHENFGTLDLNRNGDVP